MMYFALAMRDGDRIVGFVRTSVPLIRLDEELAGLRRTVAAAVGAGVLASLALGFLFAHRIARPLDSLTAAASSISRGNYARPVAAQGAGEVGRLVEAFNEMSDQLRDRMETITRDRDRVLAILRGMVEGVIAVDRDERVVHLNEPAGRMLGVASESAAGIRIWEVTRVPELGQALAEAVRAGADVVREMRLPAHPWERLVTLHASPLRGADGAFAGAVVVMHDVTELRRLEEVRRDFVANVSHELKTPITAVRGFVESILDDGSMDESVRRRFLERARDQVARLSALVTDLLTLSRVESQEGSLERAPLDLRGPVEASLRGLSAKAADKSLSLTPEIPQGAVTVAGDEELLREVADNLIDNAIKYTPAGGSVRVRLTVQSREAVLEVIDTGIGIEPHEQTRVFERFYRVDKARSRDLGGTGLGLSIVRHVVLAHRGTIELSSEPGRGSTFRVRIPTVLESD
jgi:two-component system phosphate regulon sensor histidine kinase PhoR